VYGLVQDKLSGLNGEAVFFCWGTLKENAFELVFAGSVFSMSFTYLSEFHM